MRSYLRSRAAGAARLLLGTIVLNVSMVCLGANPTLSFSPAVTHVPVKQSATVADVFTFTTGGSFKGNISLTLSGLPSSISASWSSNPVKLSSGTGYSTLTITPNSTIPPNWYTFSVTASGSGLTVTNLYTVMVEPATGVQVTLSSPAVSIQPQGTSSLTVTATAINGIELPPGATGAGARIVSTLPAGISASWSAPSVASNAVSWTLTLAAGISPVTGSYPINLSVQIVDVNSGLIYSATPGFPLLVSLLANVGIGMTPGANIPATFMGLSHEWWDAQSIMGDSNRGVNTIYRQLLTNLTAYGSEPINLRIGGNSTDTSVEPTATTVTAFAELAAEMGNRFELGVNLGAGNVNLAVDQTENFLANMPPASIEAIEIGNEPDLYYINGLRQPTYSFDNYLQEFGTWSSAVFPLLPPGVQLAGPACDYYTLAGSNVTDYLAENASALSILSEHFYAASPEDNPPPDFLLTPGAARSVVLQPNFTAAIAAAHASGLTFREDEFGAISEQAVHGISDAFGAALWSVDTMFELANAGVDGVNWEASDGNYDNPFTFEIGTSGGLATYTLTSLNPMYYGLLFFQAAVGGGVRLLPVTLSTPANLTAWAVLPASGAPCLTVINKDESQSGTVQITLPGYSQATVLRLTAPSYAATTGVTFGGQTLDGSTDGTIQGTKTSETISGFNGVFYLTMPITSAALVTFSL